MVSAVALFVILRPWLHLSVTFDATLGERMGKTRRAWTCDDVAAGPKTTAEESVGWQRTRCLLQAEVLRIQLLSLPISSLQISYSGGSLSRVLSHFGRFTLVK